MISKDKINRINYLSKKSKERTLTVEEKKEQDLLRKEYLKAIRENFKSTLDSIKFTDET